MDPNQYRLSGQQQRPPSDRHLSRQSVDSLYLQQSGRPGSSKASLYSSSESVGSTGTLVQPAPELPPTQPLDFSRFGPRNATSKEHQRDSADSSSTLTHVAVAGDEEDTVADLKMAPPSDKKNDSNILHNQEDRAVLQVNVDRTLSIYSAYWRGENSAQQRHSRLSYLPRPSGNSHNRQDSVDQFSTFSNHTLYSQTDLDLEKGAKYFAGVRIDDGSKPLPPIPPTPTPKRVLRRAGICTGMCCFAFLIVAVVTAVLYMMLAVNANIDAWGYRAPVSPNIQPVARSGVPPKSLLIEDVMGPTKTRP